MDIASLAEIISTVVDKNTKLYLVGGFNPFEKYASNWIISPIWCENKKNIWVATTQLNQPCSRNWVELAYNLVLREIQPSQITASAEAKDPPILAWAPTFFWPWKLPWIEIKINPFINLLWITSKKTKVNSKYHDIDFQIPLICRFVVSVNNLQRYVDRHCSTLRVQGAFLQLLDSSDGASAIKQTAGWRNLWTYFCCI